MNKQDSNLCEVTIYNAIAFHDDAENSKLIVEFLDEKNSRIQGIAHEDKSKFYRESDVLNQFWGANSRYDANISDIIKTFTKDKKIDEDSLYKHISSTGTNGVFGVEENKEGIDNVIIIPLEIENESNQLILRQENHPQDSELKSIISYGYWFKSKFHIDLNTGQNGFSFTSNIDFSQSVTFKSPDFKTYIQTSKKYDIRRSKVEVKDKSDSKLGEIIKVFSQSKIKYFEEWADLGIYNSSLFKVNHGTAGDTLISEGGVSSISVKADMEDLEKPRRREVNLLIFSIIFSLFTSFGFDRTRQLEAGGFSTIFPDFPYLSIDAMWLLVCSGILMKFIFIKQAKVANLVKFFLALPVGLWFISYLIIYQSEWVNEMLNKPDTLPIVPFYHTLYYCNIAGMVYMAISIVLIKVKRPKKAPGAKNDQSRMTKIFGV
ncbi:hypothetical protein VB492_18460 [Vibrio parahaemolyticus]|nr:hypothetical protein [Vibrio parahaemolyticus]HCG9432381.1 hypothetical protein [Vibrio parahaemolyticus]